MVEDLFLELSQLDQVEAIALGGSRVGIHFDEKSDYDVYLYTTGPISKDLRKEILQKHCAYMEIGNHFWEYEDNCTLKNGTDIDILYRNLDDFCADVASVVEQCHGRNGYTTCMWHNLLTCKILYDRNSRLKEAQRRFSVPYPDKLREDIIGRNWRLLQGSMPAYKDQILKAGVRGDWVSVNHRVSAFLESYFDLLFALNRRTHPGEKRLIALCKEMCPVLPEQFEENINALLGAMFQSPAQLTGCLDAILSELAKLL